MEAVKSNGVRLRLLDLYSNNLTDESVEYLGELLSEYKWLDSIGLGMNKIRKLSSFKSIFGKVGSVECQKQDYDMFLQANKQKDVVMQKNVKLRSVKKPEDPLPYVEDVLIDETTGKYIKKQYPNLGCINLVGNSLENEKDYGFLEPLLKRSPGFLLVLSYTGLEKVIDERLAESHAGKIYMK